MKIIQFIKEVISFSKAKNNRQMLVAFKALFIVSLFTFIFLFTNNILLFINILLLILIAILFIIPYHKNAQENIYHITRYTELKAVIENVDHGIIVYDPEFRIIDFNPAAEKIFDLKKEEIIGKIISPNTVTNEKLKILTQTIFPSLAPAINTVSDVGWPKIIEINFDEPHLKLKTLLNQVIDEKGKVVAFIKIIEDKTREYDILQSKSEFLTVSAHQLRTPLTALSWTIESIKKIISEEKNPNKEIKEGIDNAWNLVQRSLKIIEGLLNAAKIEEGRFDFKWQEVDLVQLLLNLKESITPLARETGISMEFNIEVKEAKVIADEEKLTMAITNLIENGIKYNTPNGLVTVRLDVYPQDSKYFRISVIDTGIGIPKESLPKLFQKFYRAENAQRVEPNGNGLGLYITKNIIEKHKGKIFVESELKRGSNFWFIIPKLV